MDHQTATVEGTDELSQRYSFTAVCKQACTCNHPSVAIAAQKLNG